MMVIDKEGVDFIWVKLTYYMGFCEGYGLLERRSKSLQCKPRAVRIRELYSLASSLRKL